MLLVVRHHVSPVTQLFAAAEVCLRSNSWSVTTPDSWSVTTSEYKDSGSSVPQRYDLDTDSIHSH